MHELRHHLSRMLADRLKNSGIVTWYDPHREFADYISELVGADLPLQCTLQEVSLGRTSTQLCVLLDSFLEAKRAIQPVVTGILPGPLLIYVPDKQQHNHAENLMELEGGGNRWEPQLERVARGVLKRRFREEQIVQIFEAPSLTYENIICILESGRKSPGSQ